MKNKCGECYFFVEKGHGTRECHRLPPVYDATSRCHVRSPVTEITFACGEFRSLDDIDLSVNSNQDSIDFSKFDLLACLQKCYHEARLDGALVSKICKLCETELVDGKHQDNCLIGIVEMIIPQTPSE